MHTYNTPQSEGRSNCTSAATLIREIKSLTEAEKGLEGKRKNIHADELALVFAIGAKIERLKEVVPFGQYKVELAKAGLSWSNANRRHLVFLIFGKYRNEPWINNFGKSAIQELAYYHSQKKNNRAAGLVEEAIELAKSGQEIGVAWVFARVEGRRREAGQPRSRLSARVRKAVHKAIEVHGEEAVVKALEALEAIGREG